MKRKIVPFNALILSLLLLGACSSGPQGRNRRVGDDKDVHGCIGSAGYQWSVLLDECIRPFEKGLKCSGIQEKNANYAAYLVFSPDSSQVEVFMAEIKNVPVLNRDVISLQKTIWTGDDPKAPVVRKTGRRWEILLGGKAAYRR